MKNYTRKRNYFSTSQKSKSVFPKSGVFRKFLPNENLYENSKEKNIHINNTELIPDYTDINKKINKSLRTVKNFFNYEKLYFKDTKPRIVETYSTFTKGLSIYFFGPNGKIPDSELLRILNQKNKKFNLNEKIYAGALDLYTTLENYNSYSERLKHSIRKKIEISGNFETVKNIDGKIHSLYLKSKNKNVKEPFLKTSNKDFFMTTVRNKTEENKINKYKTYAKNFYTPHMKKNNKKNIFDRNLLLVKKYKHYEPSKTKKLNFFSRNKSDFNKMIKNREKFKKSISSKINETESPSMILTKNLKQFFINNSRIHLKKEDKFKEDIEVIGRDDRKEYFANLKLGDIRKKLVLNPKKLEMKLSAPTKIFFSYYNSDEGQKSILDFVKEMGKEREQKKQKKYMKTFRDQFYSNWNKINKLSFELDDIKKNCKIYKTK